MKKMLVKAVALSLVLGGVGFVANNAQAADISDGVKVFSGSDLGLGFGHDVKTEKVLEKDTALANQKDLVKVNEEVATNKANIKKMQKISLITQLLFRKKQEIVKLRFLC